MSSLTSKNHPADLRQLTHKPKTRETIQDIARRLRGQPPSSHDTKHYTPPHTFCTLWETMDFDLHRAITRRLTPAEQAAATNSHLKPLVLVINSTIGDGDADAIGSLPAMLALEQVYKQITTLPNCPAPGWTTKILHA